MFIFMWVHMNVVYMHICVHYYNGQMLISSVFLTFSLLYLLRKGLPGTWNSLTWLV